jgi:hypothetical protein
VPQHLDAQGAFQGDAFEAALLETGGGGRSEEPGRRGGGGAWPERRKLPCWKLPLHQRRRSLAREEEAGGGAPERREPLSLSISRLL